MTTEARKLALKGGAKAVTTDGTKQCQRPARSAQQAADPAPEQHLHHIRHVLSLRPGNHAHKPGPGVLLATLPAPVLKCRPGLFGVLLGFSVRHIVQQPLGHRRPMRSNPLMI